MVIFSFGNMGSYCLNSFTNERTEMINVHKFLEIFLFDDESVLTVEEKTQLMVKLNLFADILMENSQLLLDYFSIEIVREEGIFFR